MTSRVLDSAAFDASVLDHPAAAAYDAIAACYDQTMQGDTWVRSLLWRRFAQLFLPGQHVLDVSCGTGTDALFLASRGVRVTGFDVSAGMVARLRDRVAAAGLIDMIDARIMDMAGLGSWADAHYDGMISTFGGLNTTTDLQAFAEQAHRLLKPDGVLVVHMLNRFSLWEWIGLVTHGRLQQARRLATQDRRTFIIGGRSLQHRLYDPVQALQGIRAAGFTLLRAYGIGAVRPPATVRRIPLPVLRMLGRLDRIVGRYPPWRDWGRFFVLELTCAFESNDHGEPAAVVGAR